jgi:methylenetetrahydrofolate reductase (NADPH)
MTTSKIANIIESGGFAVTAGIIPPEGPDTAAIAKAAEGLKGKVHAAIVSDGSGVRMSGLAACVHLAAAGIEPVLELSTRDMNRIALESAVVGASSLGVGAVVCAAGVHQALTKSKAARGVFDIDPIQLLVAVNGLQNGAKPLAGMMTNPFSDPVELQVIGLQKAIKAGAKFVITAPVFNIEKFEKWMGIVCEKGLHQQIHIIAGVLPLESRDEALDLRERLRGIDIPDAVVEKINLDFTAEMAKTLSKIEGVRGIHIFASGEGAASRVLDAAGIKAN